MPSESPVFSEEDLRTTIDATISRLNGWSTVDKGVRLAELVIASQAQISVEIGVFAGRGTLSMAIGHRHLGRGVAVGIDPWQAADCLEGENTPENDEWWAKIDYDAIYEEFVEAMVRSQLVRQCRIMRERSDTAIRLFADRSVDLLHHDGNHSEQVSCAEVTLWAPKLRPGGYWVSDDTDWPTTQRAQTLILASGFDLLEDFGNWRVYRKR